MVRVISLRFVGALKTKGETETARPAWANCRLEDTKDTNAALQH